MQVASGQSVTLACANQGYTGEEPGQAAEQHGIDLKVIKLGQAKRGFVLLPRSWMVEHSLSWSACYKRLARDYERSALSLQQLYYPDSYLPKPPFLYLLPTAQYCLVTVVYAFIAKPLINLTYFYRY